MPLSINSDILTVAGIGVLFAAGIFFRARLRTIFGPFLALFIILFFFVLVVPDWSEHQSVGYQLLRFVNFENIHNILRQSSMTSIAALGVTFIIIAGGIDLSAGSLAALTGVLIAVCLNMFARWPHHYIDPDAPMTFYYTATIMKTVNGVSVEVALTPVSLLSLHPFLLPLACAFLGVLIALIAGVFNGVLITGLNIVPFIITLGSMMIFRGSAKYFANESNVVPLPDVENNWLWQLMAPPEGNIGWMIFSPAIWITFLLAIVMTLILSYSRFGRQVIAVGSNENTARLCGIPVARTKILVYTLGGLFTGMAGLFFYSRITQGSPTSADGFELDVIAAVVIGGASLSGGKGSIVGALIGALILNVIARGCSQIHIPLSLQHAIPSIFKSSTGLPTYVQQIVTGGIIITAAFIDRLRQRRGAP